MPSLTESPADLSNWRDAPYRAAAFQAVPEIMPCAEIPAGGPMPSLPAAPASFDGFSLRDRGGAALDLPAFLSATQTDGMVVLQDGRIVFETYANGMTPATRHILMSASKSVLGLVAGILSQRGEIDIDAPVTAYVPETAGSLYEGATLRDLVDMRAGITLGPEQERAYADATNWQPAPAAATLHGFYEHLGGPPGRHGGPFLYVSANSDLLGWVLERATGRSFAALCSDLLWAPMGAELPACITLDRAGAPRTTGGICATARDLARLGQLMVQDGVRDGQAVIPSALIDDIARNGSREAWRAGQWAQLFGNLPFSYRNGWYVMDGDPQILFAMGIHGQNLFVDRANGIVIAKLSSQDALDNRAIGLTHRAVAEIRRLLLQA